MTDPTPRWRRWADPVLALVLLATAVWWTFFVGIYTLDLDPNSRSRVPDVAEVSFVLLSLGILASLVAGALARRWFVVSLALLLAGVVGALPWLSLL